MSSIMWSLDDFNFNNNSFNKANRGSKTKNENENETEYGSEKGLFTENENSITFDQKEYISSNFQDLFAKTFEINLNEAKFY